MPNPERFSSPNTPIALSIAGSDSGGGAGIQADLKTFSALGVFGTSAITAITAQNTRGVAAVHSIPEDMVQAQIKAVIDDFDVAAVKIGMLYSAAIIQSVVAGLENVKVPIVLDPVMVAKSGDNLLQQDAIQRLRTLLLPRATLLTPNLTEAATLLECNVAENEQAMGEQGQALLTLGAHAVLMKGGHAKGEECVDYLVTKKSPVLRLQARRIETKNTHGTGCTLSAAIAANLAKGESLASAVKSAHKYLHLAIRGADSLKIGNGHGPVHHFHQFW